jgi:hypothetical protein
MISYLDILNIYLIKIYIMFDYDYNKLQFYQ